MEQNSRLGYPPWSTAGGPDPDYADDAREAHHSALTSVDLLESFRQRFPQAERADYDLVIRRLGHVWDCPHDQAANAVGYRCAACGQSEAAASSASQSSPQHATNVAYIRRLCWTYADRGLNAMLEMAPNDVEWIPQLAEGRVLRGSEELRSFLTERAPQAHAPRPAEIVPAGEHVLVRFEWPEPTPRVLWSLYLFETWRLVRAISYDHARIALNAAG